MVDTGVSEYYVRCLICGKHFRKLGGHINMKHSLTARDYKEYFGLNYNQPLESEVTTAKRRAKAYEFGTYKVNCLVKGQATRHKKGGGGNKRVSEQRLEQLRMLPQRFKLKKKEQ